MPLTGKNKIIPIVSSFYKSVVHKHFDKCTNFSTGSNLETFKRGMISYPDFLANFAEFKQ